MNFLIFIEVAVNQHDHQYFLVGDAAFGVPFFRALNNGLMCGSQLAQALTHLWEGQEPENVMSSYSSFVKRLAWAEMIKAKNKRGLLRLARMATFINGHLPIQVMKWPSEKVHQFKTTDPRFVLSNNKQD